MNKDKFLSQLNGEIQDAGVTLNKLVQEEHYALAALIKDRIIYLCHLESIVKQGMFD
jgi:protein-arginine kinase activator protein McsA